MSYTSLVFFEDDKLAGQVDFHNSFGGAMRIWSSLFDKYLRHRLGPLANPLMNAEDVWALQCGKLLHSERIALLFTFDHAVVMKSDFVAFHRQLLDFRSDHPVAGSCHLTSWAEAIETHMEKQAVGLWGTSVTENPRCSSSEDDDELVLYDLGTEEKHFDVFKLAAKQESQIGVV